MADSSENRDLLDLLAEDFVARFRGGERPSLSEYVNRMPDRADEVRELFPALVELEQLKPPDDESTGDVPPSSPADPERIGEFRILRRLGVGGMGVVYEAIQESLGRHVALKLLPHEVMANPSRLERFRWEARLGRRGSITRTSCPCSASAMRTAGIITPCSTSRATRWAPSSTRSAASGIFPGRCLPPRKP